MHPPLGLLDLLGLLLHLLLHLLMQLALVLLQIGNHFPFRHVFFLFPLTSLFQFYPSLLARVLAFRLRVLQLVFKVLFSHFACAHTLAISLCSTLRCPRELILCGYEAH